MALLEYEIVYGDPEFVRQKVMTMKDEGFLLIGHAVPYMGEVGDYPEPQLCAMQTVARFGAKQEFHRTESDG